MSTASGSRDPAIARNGSRPASDLESGVARTRDDPEGRIDLPRPLRLGVGHAVAYGAITVVNAIATGRGAAIGIDLATQATVRLHTLDAPAPADSSNDPPAAQPATAPTSTPAATAAPSALRLDVQVRIRPDVEEDPTLAESAVRAVLERLGVRGHIRAEVETESTIPISRGLKSSSAAANAITLAALAATGQSVGDGPDDVMDDLAAVRLGVDAAMKAGVTITGAFDDACASYLGGLVVTDNPDRRLVHHEPLDGLEVLLVVPPNKVRTFDTSTHPTYPIKDIVDEAYRQAERGDWQGAMKRNSLAYGGAYGLSNRLPLSMLDTGAIAAGISGTGPAIAVVIRNGDWDCFTDIIHMLDPSADVLITHTDRHKARILDSPLRLQEAERPPSAGPGAAGHRGSVGGTT